MVVASKDRERQSFEFELSSTYSQGGSSMSKTSSSLKGLDFRTPLCSVLSQQRSLSFLKVVQGFKALRTRKQKQPALLRVRLRIMMVISTTISHKQPRFKKVSSTCVQRRKEFLAVTIFLVRAYMLWKGVGVGYVIRSMENCCS